MIKTIKFKSREILQIKKCLKMKNVWCIIGQPALVSHIIPQSMHVSSKRNVNRELVMPSSLNSTWTVQYEYNH